MVKKMYISLSKKYFIVKKMLSCEFSGSCSSNIKDYWSQITITTTLVMKKYETLSELPKCDKETQSEQKLLEKGCWQDLLDTWLPQTFNL